MTYYDFLCFPINNLPEHLKDKISELFNTTLEPYEFVNFEIRDTNKLEVFSYPDMVYRDALITIEELEKIIKLSCIDLVLARQYCSELLNKYRTIRNEERRIK